MSYVSDTKIEVELDLVDLDSPEITMKMLAHVMGFTEESCTIRAEVMTRSINDIVWMLGQLDDRWKSERRLMDLLENWLDQEENGPEELFPLGFDDDEEEGE